MKKKELTYIPPFTVSVTAINLIAEISAQIERYAEVPNKVPNKIPNKLRVAYPDYPEIIWEVLSLIVQNPRSTSAELGEKLGISDRMIRKHIATLRNAGIIERIGGNKGGYWKVSECRM